MKFPWGSRSPKLWSLRRSPGPPGQGDCRKGPKGDYCCPSLSLKFVWGWDLKQLRDRALSLRQLEEGSFLLPGWATGFDLTWAFEMQSPSCCVICPTHPQLHPASSKGNHLPALGQAPSSTVRPPPTPGTGREGWSPSSRVSSRALPSQKRGDHQPGDLKEPPLFNQTHTQKHYGEEGENQRWRELVFWGERHPRQRTAGAGASAQMGEGQRSHVTALTLPLLPGEDA